MDRSPPPVPHIRLVGAQGLARLGGVSVKRPPPRLFVIAARDAPVAAVLCRGPSRWAHVVRWEMDRDVFEDGAWFRGRIYEAKCDVSPDGRLFLYFCHQGSRLGSSYTDSWTAVSRLPWLHALALWPSGTTYGGGGRFVDDRTIVLRTPGVRMHPEHCTTRLRIVEGSAELQRSDGSVEDADWSGVDPNGRVIYARAGKLFRRLGGSDVVVRDFCGQEPEPQPAPDRARCW